MRLVSRVLIAFAVLLSALVVPLATAAPLTQVLVFSKTAGFRHSSIPQGIAAIRQLGRPMVVVQEGGYNREVIGECVAVFLAAITATGQKL